MGMPIEDIRQIAVPAEDGALQSALSELDSKLSQYTAALRAIADRLHAPQQDSPPAETAPEPEQPAEIPQVRKHVASRLTEHPAPAAKLERLPRPVEPEPQPAAVEPPAATDEATPASTPLTSEEAVLASLDEATAKAVRVLHRLNPQKSVEELLEHVRKHPPEQHPKQASKAWFRFGR